MEENITAIKNIITDNKKEKRKILTIYFIFFISITIVFIPVSMASIFAFMICICTLAAAYSMRAGAQEDSLTENHMTLLIRTFWRANLFFTLSSVFSLLYMAFFANYEPIKPCAEYIKRHWFAVINQWDQNDFMAFMNTCNKPFISNNYQHLVITAFIAFMPILLYLLFRCLKGWSLVVQNKLVPDKQL